MNPWEDFPTCPECHQPLGEGDVGEGRLGCLGCGHLWLAAPEEIAQQRRADEAWERELARQEDAAKAKKEAAALLSKFELAKAGRLW